MGSRDGPRKKTASALSIEGGALYRRKVLPTSTSHDLGEETWHYHGHGDDS